MKNKPTQSAEYFARKERQEQRAQIRRSKSRVVLIWDSYRLGQFIGSIRNRFTGPNRNNVV